MSIVLMCGNIQSINLFVGLGRGLSSLSCSVDVLTVSSFFQHVLRFPDAVLSFLFSVLDIFRGSVIFLLIDIDDRLITTTTQNSANAPTTKIKQLIRQRPRAFKEDPEGFSAYIYKHINIYVYTFLLFISRNSIKQEQKAFLPFHE